MNHQPDKGMINQNGGQRLTDKGLFDRDKLYKSVKKYRQYEREFHRNTYTSWYEKYMEKPLKTCQGGLDAVFHHDI